MFKLISFLFTATLLSTTLTSMGQNEVVSSGNSVNVTGGSISYTVGQIGYQSTNDPSGQLNEGVQQPLEIYTVTIEENEDQSDLFKVYPNPVTTTFQLQIDDLTSESYMATLYTLEGKVIFNRTVYSGNQTISMEELPQGTYLLHILREDKVVKMFKIIKN